MSFEILEYPLKQWIIELIDDKKIKSDVFDLLGEPDFDIRYSSDMLYNIDDLVEHEKHNLIITIIPIDRDTEYKFDLFNFAKCQTIHNQLIGILREADAVFKYIIKHTDENITKIFGLDKLSVKLTNNLKLELCYNGNDKDIDKKVKKMQYYVYNSEIVYTDDNDGNDNNSDDNDSNNSDNDSNNSDDELKKVLDKLVLENFNL